MKIYILIILAFYLYLFIKGFVDAVKSYSHLNRGLTYNDKSFKDFVISNGATIIGVIITAIGVVFQLLIII
jgi:hypothetical protein